ncbi:hypothetical protein [Actinoplanes regularis]|uniref:hypothetical protein n=1 Tax=Actinoplanes regularis TaxID=52697 RepID=UPI0024A1466D|nr:hypothetical protein [Actinoplanes regularis]GLW30173.1 hypothetical protein Areg01_31130 [Actinoplanes regularis]
MIKSELATISIVASLLLAHGGKVLRISKVVSRAVAAAGVGVALAASATIPAQAATYEPDNFYVCSYYGCGYGATEGTLTWYDRTVNAKGYVGDYRYLSNITVIFEAYQGSVKVGTPQTRTANNESSLGEIRDFNLTLGDTDLSGGVDRVKVTLCNDYQTANQVCAPVKNYYRS